MGIKRKNTIRFTKIKKERKKEKKKGKKKKERKKEKKERKCPSPGVFGSCGIK